MSRCPSDRPVLNSILCLLSLSWLSPLSLQVFFYHFSALSLSIFTNLSSSCFSHPLLPIFSISAFLPLSTVNLFSSLMPCLAVLHILFLSLILSSAPSAHLSSFLWNPTVSLHNPLGQLSCSVRLSRLPYFHIFFLFSPISYCHSLLVFPLRQLMENKITTIERGAFQDLKELERLWVTIRGTSIVYRKAFSHATLIITVPWCVTLALQEKCHICVEFGTRKSKMDA